MSETKTNAAKALLGKKAPTFALQGVLPPSRAKTRTSRAPSTPDIFSLDLLKDKTSDCDTLVIYFYPKDDTPGCTKEAIDFTQHAAQLKKLKAKVFGISKDTCERHEAFIEKYQLGIALLSDPDLKVAKAYGAYGKKVLYGKESMGIIRSTFVIRKDGLVSAVFSPVKVDGHAAKVIESIKGY